MIAGYVHPDFAGVATELARQLRKRRVGGSAICIYHRGEKVIDIWGGDRNAAGDPWEADTMALSFSTTKGVTTTALHVLADAGEIDYDDRVVKYWPEFGAAGKSEVTVRHMLAHQTGLHRLRTMVSHAKDMLDWDYMTAVIAAAEPAYEPGTRHGYHAVTFGWTVGELVRRVSGISLGDFVRKEIAGPLGEDGLHIGVPLDQRHRVAELTQVNRAVRSELSIDFMTGRRLTRESTDALLPHGIVDLFWSDPIYGAELGGANGVFTARALASMYVPLASPDTANGFRLSRDRVVQMGHVQTRGLDVVFSAPFRKRLGYHDIFTTAGMEPSAFGHWGLGGSGAWADPRHELAVAFVTNVHNFTPLMSTRIMRIGGVAVRAAKRR